MFHEAMIAGAPIVTNASLDKTLPHDDAIVWAPPEARTAAAGGKPLGAAALCKLPGASASLPVIASDASCLSWLFAEGLIKACDEGTAGERSVSVGVEVNHGAI